MAKIKKPELSEMSRIINKELEQCPPSPINVLPDILTRQPTPAEIEEERRRQQNQQKAQNR